MMQTPEQLNDEIDRRVIELEAAQRELDERTAKWADAETAYRKRKSIVFLTAADYVEAGTKLTDATRSAIVDRECEKERHAAHLAEGLKNAAHENVRNRRTILSAVQTKCGNVKAEADLSRGPQPSWSKASSF